MKLIDALYYRPSIIDHKMLKNRTYGEDMCGFRVGWDRRITVSGHDVLGVWPERRPYYYFHLLLMGNVNSYFGLLNF